LNKESHSELADGDIGNELEESADVSKVNLLYGVMDNGVGDGRAETGD